MDEKSLNLRKETYTKRMVTDTILLITGIICIVFLSLITDLSSIFSDTTCPLEDWTMGQILITISLIMIASLIFAYRRYHDIKDAIKEFNSINAIKEEFIANLRHELKTPLVPIRGYSEILYDGSLGEINKKQKEALKKMFDSSEKLERLIDSLIFISVARSGDIEYTFTTLKINDVATGAIVDIADQLSQREQEIDIDIRSDLPYIEGDRKYLKEALIQILENASKFSPNGQKIQLIIHEGYKSLHIKVIDRGIGIPEEELDNIFARFYQIDGSKTRRYGGNGLGLHIARTIVEAHRGNIWIESEPEIGTTVHVRLPTPNHGVKK
ncbi:His Kinase A (phospho-acceptor) domain-containing protein [Methanolobus vulcani]|jgi:signal transduction histidine kinase|uniref:histidine kinase n=1 Tax=Methanolobus vulcani TaxID=38026 RepID=A0A7Z7FC62_9EURY|nr:HAMP domain-containing sensor histidine kinase [Methanolobus vulcani]SDF67606.1 His Kinase A (phospho-acceptor) domain-containing protein [Methanolobus vulcani]